MPNFLKEKADFLSKKDKSKKGSMDREIKPLVDLINSYDNYYTTSSCSGRILLIEIKDPNKKNESKWHFETHNYVKSHQLKNAINKIKNKKICSNKVRHQLRWKNDIWLRAEAAILHVACKDIESALRLLDIARHSGFKRSGIISITKSKAVLELISTERIDAIASKDGKWLIDDDYFKALIEEANTKLRNTREKIRKFYDAIK